MSTHTLLRTWLAVPALVGFLSVAATLPVCAQELAAPPMQSNSVALDALLSEWNRAGFLPPSKPAQSLVYGRHGYMCSGPSYNAMVSLIRFAEHSHGRDAAAFIAEARRLLAASSAATALNGARSAS